MIYFNAMNDTTENSCPYRQDEQLGQTPAPGSKDALAAVAFMSWAGETGHLICTHPNAAGELCPICCAPNATSPQECGLEEDEDS